MSSWSFFKGWNSLSSKGPYSPDQESPSFGRFRFRFQNDQGSPHTDTIDLTWQDFNDHLLITGGSGSGKTSTVLHQLYEGLAFRSADHSELSVREQYQVGGLIIEAKGDFTPKTKILARRYQRENSIIYFGPEHPESIYDPFGDSDELPLQRAHKLNEIIKAVSGGKEGGDPFWAQASQKLLSSLFLVYDEVKKSGMRVPPLSFHYLSLLTMDKGVLNVSDVEMDRIAQDLKEAFKKMRLILMEIDWILESFWEEVDGSGYFQQQLIQIREMIVEMQSEFLIGFDNQAGKKILKLINETREGWIQVLGLSPTVVSKNLREKITLLFNQENEISIYWRLYARKLSQQDKKGALIELLEQYQALLEERGESLESNALYSYFKNEYLNRSNEKTSASISMVVSNALMPFVTAPFNRLFSPQASFSFSKVIDEGLIVVLDMPSAQYGVAQLLVSLVIKMDFFRAVLNRSRLVILKENRPVNQQRHLLYLCDEFGSVATTGDQTGESAFLDKAREYRCSCLLAMQGLPSLLRKFSEKEVDALLQNCGTKIFLRNDDPTTNDYASRSLGSEVKVKLNQNTGAMEHWADSQKKWGARAYTTSYERAARFTPDQFVSFRVGEGVLRLPARFGEQMVRRVRFDFNPILP